MLSGWISQYMVIGGGRDEHGNVITGVNVPAFAMKVIQSEEDLVYYPLRDGHGEPVLSRRSNAQKAGAQGVCHEAYVSSSAAFGDETVSEGQTVGEPGAAWICGFDLPKYLILWRGSLADANAVLRRQDLYSNERSGFC
jgi:hypothetical protein